MKSIITMLFCFSLLLQAEWISFNKGSGKEPSWQENNRSLQTLEYKITIPGMNCENKSDGGGFKLYSFVPELYRTCAEGEPKVPSLRQFLAIPECSGAIVEVIPGETITYENTRLYPRGKDGTVGGVLTEIFTNQWQTVYPQISGYYPAQNYKLALPAIRGQRIADVELYPVSFNAAQNKVKVVTEYTIRLTFTNPTGSYSANTGIFNGAVSGNVLGYNDNSGITASVNTGKNSLPDVKRDCLPTDGVDYLFIMSDSLWDQPGSLETLQRLADWRSRYNGYKVGLLRRSAISINSVDPTHYKNIRKYIADFYTQGFAAHTYDGHLGYVCLVGDYTVYDREHGLPPSYDKVPGGEYIGDDPNPYANNMGFTSCGSDYYYSCVTKDAITGDYDELGDLFIAAFLPVMPRS